MVPEMRQYLDVLRKVMDSGIDRIDRTGVGTRAIFGEVMRFRMADGFPAVTTKRLAFRSVVAELLWFLAGSSDVNEASFSLFFVSRSRCTLTKL